MPLTAALAATVAVQMAIPFRYYDLPVPDAWYIAKKKLVRIYVSAFLFTLYLYPVITHLPPPPPPNTSIAGQSGNDLERPAGEQLQGVAVALRQPERAAPTVQPLQSPTQRAMKDNITASDPK